MSYCRFSDTSDVYVYESSKGFECCGCTLPHETTHTFSSETEMIKHLMKHRKMGHLVPQHAINRLRMEAKESKQ